MREHLNALCRTLATSQELLVGTASIFEVSPYSGKLHFSYLKLISNLALDDRPQDSLVLLVGHFALLEG